MLSKAFLKKRDEAEKLKAFWFGYRLGIKYVRNGMWYACGPEILRSRNAELSAKRAFKDWISPFDRSQRENNTRPDKRVAKKKATKK